MDFDKAIKEMKIIESRIAYTDEYGNWNFNIDFINDVGEVDQTQLDVRPYLFDYTQRKCPELHKLWKNFCKENNFKQTSIICITMIN